MCGIVSVIQKDWSTTLNYTAERVFKQMLFANVLRGGDGTGMFWKDSVKEKVFYNKVAAPSWEAIPKLKELNEIAGIANWVVGHNRKATMGVHTEDNTHPFCEGPIVLVHNGTLTNLWELEKVVGKCAVDSQAIAKLLAKFKPKQALEMVEGAYALVWYNTDEAKLYYTRNNERPLWLVESETHYFLVSEAELAEWIAARNDILITKITEVAQDKIYSMGINRKGKLQISVVNFTPKVKKYVTTPKYPTYAGEYSDYSGYQPSYLPPPTYKKPQKGKPESWFTIADTVVFAVTSTYAINGVTKLRGRTVDKPVFQVETTALDPNKLIPRYDTIMEGTITNIKYAFNTWVIECSNIAPYVEYKNEHGLYLTDRVINQLDSKKCVACDADPTNDMEHAWVYFNSNTQEHEFLCPTCNKTGVSGDMKKYGTAA